MRNFYSIAWLTLNYSFLCHGALKFDSRTSSDNSDSAGNSTLKLVKCPSLSRTLSRDGEFLPPHTNACKISRSSKLHV